MGLATTQTKVCSVTPIPFRSPRGHLQSLKVATPLSFLFCPALCEQVHATGYNKKSLARLSKMGLATTQTKVCFVTPIPFRSPRGHRQSLKVATPLSFLFSPAVCEQVPTAGYNKKSLAVARLSNFGWKMGFEPTTFGTTIRHSNRLSYIHHLIRFRIGDKSNTDFLLFQIYWAVFLILCEKTVARNQKIVIFA